MDDWARRKGQTYGTIVVDLDTREPVDLLPDRTAETLATWLEAHPGVEVISRDRAGASADGARQGAPEAVQVADRFHLLHNLTDMLRTLFNQHAGLLDPIRRGQAAVEAPAAAEPRETPATEMPALPAASDLTAAEARRADRRQAAQRLHQQGLSQKRIAHELGLHPKTIRRYLRRPASLRSNRPRRRRQLDPCRAYLEQRFQEGCDNATALWCELRAQGFPGGITQVRAFVASLRGTGSAVPRPPSQQTLASLAFLVARDPATRSDEQQHLFAQLLTVGEPIAAVCQLGQEFARLIRDRQEGGLPDWMSRAEASGIAELQRFVNGLRRDEQAVPRSPCLTATALSRATSLASNLSNVKGTVVLASISSNGAC